ncbi:hypothetical protein [Propioniciclava coleopterorum]|nr:hypothetical protein [Propioniciclava coleopterorum]
MKRANKVRLAAVIASLAVLATGCSSGGGPGATPTPEGPATIRFAW